MSVIHFSIQNTNILNYCMLIDLYTVVEHVAMQRTAKMQKQNQEIMNLLRCFRNIFQSFHLLIGFWIGFFFFCPNEL